MNQTTILDEIVESKRLQLESQKGSMPLSSFKRQMQKSDRDFALALRSPKPAFILECKKASPSKGLIRSDFDLVSIATTYGQFASAISVLTESEYFQGSLANLGIIRQHAPQPLLCKDFFVDPYQVYQARHFGADAILLILAILDDDQWKQLIQLAQSLGMDAITEISNREEQQRAISLKAPIVGINNRDLRDMSVNLETTRELSRDIPDETLVISESGYYTNWQVRSMCDCADGFLIGSSLMGERNLSPAVKRVIFGDCKVCGLTRHEDAVAADRAGALYGGVIFADSSPRRVAFEKVDAIFEGTSLKRVGVFQDHSIDQIVHVAQRCKLDAIQLHGDEEPQLVRGLIDQIGHEYQYWKALSVFQLAGQAEEWFGSGVERLIVDNISGDQKGGTGKSFDWSTLPAACRNQVIIAGGIGPENVSRAMALGCCGVDMNSRLEETIGIKSAVKIKAAFGKIRNYRTANG